jgi:hypothetical protein
MCSHLRQSQFPIAPDLQPQAGRAAAFQNRQQARALCVKQIGGCAETDGRIDRLVSGIGEFIRQQSGSKPN